MLSRPSYIPTLAIFRRESISLVILNKILVPSSTKKTRMAMLVVFRHFISSTATEASYSSDQTWQWNNSQIYHFVTDDVPHGISHSKLNFYQGKLSQKMSQDRRIHPAEPGCSRFSSRIFFSDLAIGAWTKTLGHWGFPMAPWGIPVIAGWFVSWKIPI